MKNKQQRINVLAENFNWRGVKLIKSSSRVVQSSTHVVHMSNSPRFAPQQCNPMNGSIAADTVRTERKHATLAFPTPAGRAAKGVDDKATAAAAAWEAQDLTAAKPTIGADESDAVFLPSTPIPDPYSELPSLACLKCNGITFSGGIDWQKKHPDEKWCACVDNDPSNKEPSKPDSIDLLESLSDERS